MKKSKPKRFQIHALIRAAHKVSKIPEVDKLMEPWQLSFPQFISACWTEALKLTNLIDSSLPANAWESLLWKTYINELVNAMEQRKDIPLKILKQSKSFLPQKKLIAYLRHRKLTRAVFNY